MSSEHQAPWDCVLAKENEGVCRPGSKPATEQEYFEILCLCLLQAGLNWNSIRKHWQRYRQGFQDFEIDRLAQARVADILVNPNAIKNARKIEAIIHNAGEFRRIESEFGSFGEYLETLQPLPEKEQLKALAKRFKQVGPETADYFLHSVGFYE